MWLQTLPPQMCWFRSWRRWLWRCASTQFTSPCLLVGRPRINEFSCAHMFYPHTKNCLFFRNCLLLCLCVARSHSPQCHCVWAQQHEDGWHDEGRLCDEPDLRDHTGGLHQQLRGATFWAGRVPWLGPSRPSKCVSLLPITRKSKHIQWVLALEEMNEGCEVRRIRWWYSDSLNV